jgi:hypothetical protein
MTYYSRYVLCVNAYILWKYYMYTTTSALPACM